MITTASPMSTNNAAIGITITGRPIPVTALEIDPMTTATSTMVNSTPVTTPFNRRWCLVRVRPARSLSAATSDKQFDCNAR